MSLSFLRYNGKVILRASSVNYKRKTWPSHFLTYISRTEQTKQRSCVIPDASIISPLTVLLFNQNDIICKKASSDEDVLININKLRNAQFCCDEEYVASRLFLNAQVLQAFIKV